MTIVTKSAGVLADADILTRLAARNLVRVWVSVTTLDGALARSMEPRASTPARRLQAMTRDVLDTESIESGRFGYVRHPVFGTDVWVQQPVTPGWFDRRT